MSNSERMVRTFCGMRKDKRYRAGVIDSARHFEKITQRQWLDLRVEFTDYKNYAKEDAYLRRRGE